MTTRTANKLAVTSQASILMSAFLLGVLFFWSQHSVNAASTTTTIEANIVSTINIIAQNGVTFGDIGPSATPGTVSVDANGSRTTTGGVTITTSTAGLPAQFEVSGDPNSTYGISLPTSVVITSTAGDNMTVNNFNTAANGQLDAGGKQNLDVVATLNVGSFQAFGAYSGIMSATVEYN